MARAATTTDVFNAIAEPRRREIVGLINDGRDWAVGDVVVKMRMAQPSVSKHLNVLRKVGVVTVVKRGKQRLYRLQPERLISLHEWVAGVVQKGKIVSDLCNRQSVRGSRGRDDEKHS
jgi:DNA-binding transcriptional ArsR family regulator